MISNFFELGAFGFLILTAYELAGKAAAFGVIAICLFVIGLALDGIELPNWRKPQKPKRKTTDEPLTNQLVDQRELDLSR